MVKDKNKFKESWQACKLTAMTIWYPYTQMKTMRQPLCVKRAFQARLELDSGDVLIDAISSWWCVIHGYNHPQINDAVQKQLEKMAHVMLGGLTHDTALQLAEALVKITPPKLSHVFFSDSGSVGCEVALKMAWQFWINKGERKKQHFIALKKGYHGDTIGVMSVGSDDESMHTTFQGHLPKQFFVEPENITELESVLSKHHTTIAAMIIEPLMQGAGGFLLHSANYVKEAKSLCEHYNILFIVDEVATGFGRLGTLFAMDQVGVSPDIMVLGKGLTAGYSGMAATIATSEVFDAFYDNSPKKAFMHGPTFMGNPIACAAALANIHIFESTPVLASIATMESVLKDELSGIHSNKVKDVRIKGAMACIEARDTSMLKDAQKIAHERGVWLRPFDKFLYTMPPYCTKEEDIRHICRVMKSIL